MSELTKRILFALVAAPVFTGLLWLGDWYFFLLMTVIAIFVQREIVNMIASGSQKPCYLSSLLLLIWVLSYPFEFFFLEIAALIFGLIVVKETLTGDAGFFQNISATFFAALYPAFTFLAIILIRFGPFEWSGHLFPFDIDIFALTFLFVLMIWGNDVFAYFGGRFLGKKPLAPTISPKKTWEGFYFGFLGGLTALLLLSLFFNVISDNFWLLVPAIIITGIFGPVGDLAASKIKRAYQIKDSSTILPGHGGFFDRFDAMMLSAPVYLVYLHLIVW